MCLPEIKEKKRNIKKENHSHKQQGKRKQASSFNMQVDRTEERFQLLLWTETFTDQQQKSLPNQQRKLSDWQLLLL